ncbi:MAG: DUF362 domain-containing protein [Planctomycetota bacterium]|nr:DUF362 domain-containing protein [Planctomycetota bacterium]
MLDKLPLKSIVEKKRTAIKLHLGGGTGFTTVHPFFVRKLVEKVKAAGARGVFVTDTPWAVFSAHERGYSSETIGCPLVAATGSADKYFYTKPIKPPFKALKEVELAGEIVDAEALLDVSHVKGHGACGFGGASKNLSMGCVSGRTRGVIHSLEGGLDWNRRKCTHCGKCVRNCPNKAMSFNQKRELNIFFHNCKLCQHCSLICPHKAIRILGGAYRDFQHGMALATAKVLEGFEKKHRLFINFLTNITVYCDCWGMSGPAIVPDIGILAGQDICAIEQASLDMIRTEDLIPGTLPKGWKLRGHGHLFARIHSKDPLVVLEFLEKLKQGSRKYKVTEVM